MRRKIRLTSYNYFCRRGFVPHGAADGKSRPTADLNRSSAVLTVCESSRPSTVSSDYGGEHSQLALFMNLVQGVDRRSLVTGEQNAFAEMFSIKSWCIFTISSMLERIQSFLIQRTTSTNSPCMSSSYQRYREDEHFRDAWNHHKHQSKYGLQACCQQCIH